MKLIKRLLFILVVAVAIYAGFFLNQQGTGYVLIQYQDFSIESSVFVFAGFLIILFIVIYFLLRSVLNLFKIPDFISRRYTSYQNKKSSAGLISGLLEFSQGQFKKAESSFIKQAAGNENSYLNYLLAARAAQLLHADARRDEHLKQAFEINPDASIAIGLTQAELQLSHHQNELALATLNQLLLTHPKHDFVLRLLSRAYLQLEDWAHLCPLLSELRQSKTLPEDVLIKTEKIAYKGNLEKVGRQKDTGKLETIWSGMPKYLKKDNDFITLYAKQLIANDQFSQAELLLREKLNKNWDDKLIILYSEFVERIHTDNNEKYFTTLLEVCEKWLRTNPHNATLLLTAGKICTVLHLWGKARSYFDSSLSIQPHPETYLQIALLLEQTNHPEEAHKYYQLGLKQSISKSKGY